MSFTLDACKTDTTLIATENSGGTQQIEVYVDGMRQDDFLPKVEKLISYAISRFPKLGQFNFRIETSNTFPHSSGIASSASGMSALALCLVSLAQSENILESDFMIEAGVLARLGSGSACRSLYGGVVEWGIHEALPGSSDDHALQVRDVHPVFQNYRDTILLIHKGRKHVSSTAGHNLLDDHPFASTRFELANANLLNMLGVLRTGDLAKFIEITEAEALMLHALMMTSNPSFLLMQAGTVAVIHKIREFREQYSIPVAFTLDAGANVHVLYPAQHEAQVLLFIENELAQHCQDRAYLCDAVGQGPNSIPC